MAAVDLTAQRLRELLDYDPAIGAFIWLVRAGIRIKIGDIAGTTTARGYRVIKVDGRGYMAHRLAWLLVHGVWPKAEIDHINGERDDNRSPTCVT